MHVNIQAPGQQVRKVRRRQVHSGSHPSTGGAEVGDDRPIDPRGAAVHMRGAGLGHVMGTGRVALLGRRSESGRTGGAPVRRAELATANIVRAANAVPEGRSALARRFRMRVEV